MGKILKAVIFGGKARVAVLDTTDTVNEAIRLHKLSPLAAAALGRALTAGAYISSNLKNPTDRFSLTIDGGGPLGKIIVAGEAGGYVRGYVQNPYIELLYRNGKLDVGGAVGRDGYISVIRDLGLKEPYAGRCKLTTGEIAEDFAAYLTRSEGIPAAVALGVLTGSEGCKAAGGVIVEAMPDISEEQIVMLEDIMTNFMGISSLLAQKSAEEILDFYFGHLDAEVFVPQDVSYVCRCGQKMEGIIKSLGEEEARAIISERGEVEIKCDFCGSAYTFGEADIDKIFGSD